MTRRPTKETTAGQRYLALQRKARRTGRPTDELIQLYALEGFLDRLTKSQYAENLVLKGGVLLAALDARRPALLPLFDFFRMHRNRTLHQDGTAGSSLSDLSRSRELKDAYGSLAASVRRMTPMLPTLRPQQLIALTSSQAILFLIVARGLFDALAMQVRSRLNTDGYLRMAAHYAYGIAHHPFRAAFDHKFVEASAGRYLRERYRVTGAIRTPLVPGFRRLGLWDSIVSRYHDLSTSVPSGTS